MAILPIENHIVNNVNDGYTKVLAHVKKGVSTNTLTWLILGGADFMQKTPVNELAYLNCKVHKYTLLMLSKILDVPMKSMATLLHVSSKTLSRKNDTDILDHLSSSLSIEIASTIAKGLTVFGDIEKLKHWLQHENKALNNQKPFDLLNTPTGLKMVNRIFGRIEEGIYS
jgi:putative toxin-antitoxin system antitoxin component (TIGR02293 family)